MPAANAEVTAVFREPLVAVTYYDDFQYELGGQTYTVVYGISRNTDQTLTVVIEYNDAPVGFVPQINIDGKSGIVYMTLQPRQQLTHQLLHLKMQMLWKVSSILLHKMVQNK